MDIDISKQNKKSHLLYVAGSWDDREHVKLIMQALERRGFTIAEDWTQHTSDDGSACYCALDVIGVRKCQTLVLINSDKTSAGKYFECGMAFAWGKRIVSVGSKPTTVFRHLISLHIDIPIFNIEKIAEKLESVLLNEKSAATAADLLLRFLVFLKGDEKT